MSGVGGFNLDRIHRLRPHGTSLTHRVAFGSSYDESSSQYDAQIRAIQFVVCVLTQAGNDWARD